MYNVYIQYTYMKCINVRSKTSLTFEYIKLAMQLTLPITVKYGKISLITFIEYLLISRTKRNWMYLSFTPLRVSMYVRHYYQHRCTS